MKKYVAFFDVDHTILSGNSGKLLVLQAYKYRMFSTRDFFTGSCLSWLYKLRLIRSEKMIKIMIGWLKGISEAKLNELVSKVFEDVIKNYVRIMAGKEVEWHNNNNGQTVILSSAISHMCAPIKEYLNMDDMICTNIEVIDGFFTGLPKGKYCYKKEKLYQAKRYCEKHNFSLADAYFYSDSSEDLSLLEQVGNPVCVNPEIALEKIARQKKWPVEYW